MKLRLKVSPPKGTPFEFSHPGPVVRVGRDPSAELHLDGPYQDNVSWDHARITLSDKAATITDTNSTNGTYLNDSPDRLKSCALKIGDEVRLGMTGPRLRVTELSLAEAPRPSAMPPPAARARRTEAPASAPLRAMSQTRHMLLMTQENNRRNFLLAATAFLVLLLLLATGLFLFNWVTHRAVDDTSKKVADIGTKQDKMQETIADLGQGLEATNRQMKANHEDLTREMNRRAQEYKETADQMRDDLRRNTKDLGDRIGDLSQAAPKAADGGKRPALDALRDDPLVFKDNMRLSVKKKNSGNHMSDVDYKDATLAFATKDALHLVSFENTRKVIPFDEIATIYVNNQMYEHDRRTGEFVPGVSYFRLDRRTGQFVRFTGFNGDLELMERGHVVGESDVRCIMGQTAEGLVVCLPRRSFPSIGFDAKAFGEIITTHGVYRYIEARKEYDFQRHEAVAKQREEERFQKLKEYDELKWKRRTEGYKLVTDRVKALAVYRNRWWNWW